MSRDVEYYNLDEIISVGYRVKSLLQALMRRFYSSNRYKIKCTGRHINTRRQKLFINGQMLKKNIWD